MILMQNKLIDTTVAMRAEWLRWQGVPLAPEVGRFRPMPLASIREIIHDTSLI